MGALPVFCNNLTPIISAGFYICIAENHAQYDIFETCIPFIGSPFPSVHTPAKEPKSPWPAVLLQ